MMTLLSHCLARLKTLRDNRRGNVLLLFGLSIIPLAFATGMGIDYSMAMRLETKLNSAADAAALASTTTPMLSKTMSQACTAALNMFRLQSSGLAGLTLDTNDPSQFSVTVTENYATSTTQTGTCGSLTTALAGSLLTPLSRVTTVTYRGQSANTFSALLGKPSLTVQGTASTKVATAPFIDIHMALDTSQSMGLAATDADALNLYTKTGLANGTANSCTFGCHAYSVDNTSNVLAGGSTGSPNASYKAANDVIASVFGITLRIDVLKQATQSMIATALLNEGTSQLYRFALYRIGANTSTIAPLTTNIASASTAVGNLTLGPNTAAGTGDSNLPDMTNYVLPNIVAHGDGTTQANARAFLFIVTDGVTDLYGSSCRDRHCMATISPASCQAYKNANVTVGVVYTTYLPVKANPTNPNSGLDGRYTDLISPLPPATIGTQLQACASPGWFFEASDGPSIQTAMQKLFSQASQTPVITH